MVLTLLLCMISSCLIVKRNADCKLLPDQNEIIGSSKNAPTLEIEKRFLMALIAYLYEIPRESFNQAYNREYNWMDQGIWDGFKISGCQDTTFAKRMMADHLCAKHGFYTKDSVYLDTIYRIELLDRSKLPIQNEDCSIDSIMIKRRDKRHYSTMPCIEWDAFFVNIVYDLCHRGHCYALEIPDGEGKLFWTTPVKESVEHDVEKLTAYYEEQWGVRITQERIDSVDVLLIKKIPDARG